MRVTAYDAVGVSGSDMSDDDFCPPYMSDGSGGDGQQRRQITIMGVDDTPSRTALFQNYPNPFNPVTQIRYSLRTKCRVQLSVFNVLGQKVCTLVDEVQTPGHRTVEWNATNCASGVYFYRLQAGDFVKTNKMILMR